MRLIFMGTPQFAVPTLEALVETSVPGRLAPEGVEIVSVVTRPDKPSGRGQGVVRSPVKEQAQALGLPVWQPGPLRRPENLEELRRLAPDVIVVAAFGQILRREVLELPRFRCLNVHASLLPRHRGASPITASILAGDAEAGVTIMLMDEGLDTGPMLAQRSIPIAPDDTTGSLTGKLSHLGAELLLETLPRWVAGTITPQPQDDAQATHTGLLKKEDGIIDWQLPAEVLARQVRAYIPWPGASTTWRGKMLKIQQATALEPEPAAPTEAAEPAGKASLRGIAGAKSLLVRCGQGYLRLEVIQLEGKRAMSADEFVRGQAAIIGDTLGNHA
ncbi:MAG TPA: methionyl-tRNA formyltransferase [Ktedonobacterales bacterium]|nr:methionyl-tRNA formyltransferase [Ktedonobacterales bacterium]